ncbi:hypothetical protein B0T24DRAFT_662434 [Lasiosphaeria ovina]|uniref:Uncharacterized protein n=1 Tax=Lasiosphaeria ovina TaxID=92902 RepID=A0AAE0TYF0_9PEZI|nr:hypothetical protein B0T24DRAFT_662434 [Lasiosphaeria ovina]
MSNSPPAALDGALGDDLEVASKSLSNGERVVFQVIDADFGGSTTPQVLKTFRSSDDIAKGMETLPPHTGGTARILDITIHSDFVITGLRDTRGPETTRPARDFLISFLKQRHTRPFEERRIFRWLNDPLLVNDIGSISSQWSQSLGGDSVNFYRLVNRTSLQQNPLDLDLHPRDSYLTCVQDTDDRLIVIIVNDVWSEQNFSVNKSSDDGIIFQNPRGISAMLAGTGWTSLSDGTLDTFAKLLILDFFLASIYLQRVDYYGDLIYPKLAEKEALKFSLAKNPHLQVPLGLFEPRLSAKSRDAFKEIEDAEGILRSVNNLVDSIEFVVEALKAKNTAATDRVPHKDFERRMQELGGLCSERRSNAQRALEALNRQLDYLTKKHAIREAKAIKVLTILASLYLPLSLSATLLGMQTPFRMVAHTIVPSDQTSNPLLILGTNLLFDFFGVFIWLATSTICILYAIQLALWLRSNGLGKLSRVFSGPFSIFSYGKRWRFGGRGGRAFELLRGVTAWWVGLGFCVTLLVIFFVGMLRTAQDAWDTAWRIFTVYLAVGVALFVSCAGIYGYLYYRKGGVIKLITWVAIIFDPRSPLVFTERDCEAWREARRSAGIMASAREVFDFLFTCLSIAIVLH